MFRGLYSYFFGETETDLSLEEARIILNAACTTNDKQETANAAEADAVVENTTFHKVGVITARNDNKYTIDNLYSYECGELNGNVGDRVSYISYVSERKLFVTNVSVIANDWDTTPANVQSSWCNRTLTVKVVERNLREIVVHPGTIKIDLNKVHSEFIPLVGDWLQVEAKCDLDENVSDLAGQILQVTRIKPLRLKRTVGIVKRWDANSETGLIDRDIFFNFDALSCGYSPCVGDKVVVESIESEQNFCTWRAAKVVPQVVVINNERLKTEPEFENEIEGLAITNDIVVEFEKPRESRIFCVEVRNKTDVAVVLKQVEFLNRNGQCKLEGSYKDCVIKPSDVLEIPCKCTSRNYGRSKELLLFTFENHLIGRYITVALKPRREQTFNSPYSSNNRATFTFKEQHHRQNDNYRDVIPGPKLMRAPAFVAKRIGQHKIPDKLWDLFLEFSYDAAMLSEALLKKKPCLHNLDYHCYEDYFHTLLHLEEIEYVVALRKYDEEKACFIANGEYLMLEIENLAEKRPSIMIGDKVIASDPFNCSTSEFESVVHKVGSKHIYLKFCQMFHDGYKGEDYSVRIVGSRSQIRRNHHGIGLAVRSLGRELLFPTKVQLKPAQFNLIETTPKSNKNRNQAILQKLQEIRNNNKSKLDLTKPKNSPTATEQAKPTDVKIVWYDKHLNHYQMQAVRNILLAEARPLPYCIFGPPGTGKTVTLVETILQILTHLPDARILVGTPSNSAADVVATRLIESGVLKPGDLIRFVAYRCVQDDSIPVQLIPYSATADITAEGTDHNYTHTTLKNGLTLGLSCSVIGRHRVTVSTCTNLGMFFNMNFPKGHFTHIILDEAGHLTEPEAMIPLSFLDVSSGQAILAGDPLQLGPVVLSRLAAEYGLAESYLERLMNRFPYTRDPQGFPETGGYDPRLVTKLVYNYRSLPDILAIPSKLFYNSELTPTVRCL